MKIRKIEEPMEAFHTIDKQTAMELGEVKFDTYDCTFRVKPRELLKFINFLSKNNIFNIFVDTISEEDIMVGIDGETIKNIKHIVL